MNGEKMNIPQEYFKSYEDFSRNLRLWYLTFGVGSMVALLTSGFWAKLVEAKCSQTVGFYLIAGLVLQLSSAFVNKHTQLQLAYAEIAPTDRKIKANIVWKISDWYSEQHWIDFLIDYQTFIFFLRASILTFQILSNDPGSKVCTADDSGWAFVWFVALWLVTPSIFAYVVVKNFGKRKS